MGVLIDDFGVEDSGFGDFFAFDVGFHGVDTILAEWSIIFSGVYDGDATGLVVFGEFHVPAWFDPDTGVESTGFAFDAFEVGDHGIFQVGVWTCLRTVARLVLLKMKTVLPLEKAA